MYCIYVILKLRVPWPSIVKVSSKVSSLIDPLKFYYKANDPSYAAKRPLCLQAMMKSSQVFEQNCIDKTAYLIFLMLNRNFRGDPTTFTIDSFSWVKWVIILANATLNNGLCFACMLWPFLKGHFFQYQTF